MMDKLYQDIAESLKAIRSCEVSREEVPQNFREPCFLVMFYDQNPTRGINGRLKNTVRTDVAYFPEDKQNYNTECWTLGEQLIREFGLADFKIRNRNLKIIDRVLHFLFDVDYREYLENSGVKMRMQTITEKLKEE